MITSIHLPEYWTIEQAEFVHDFADLLYEAVWRQYGQKLCEHWEAPKAKRQISQDACEPASMRKKEP